MTTVSANTVAVVTEFGRYQGTLDSCLRIVADWKQDMQGPIPTTFNCAFGASGAPVIVGR